MRVAIVDDEPLARSLLRRLLAAHPDIDVIAEAGDGNSAITAITQHQPDVVFLDIEMPGRDGFGVLASLSSPPLVVFVTAHDHYAVRAFEVEAIDYLRKPFDDQRLAITLDRLRERKRDPDALRRALETLTRRARLAVREGDATVLLALDDIESLEASGKYVDIHLATGHMHTVRDTLTSLEQRLDGERFVRIHRSAIVHLDHVRVVKPFFAGDQELVLTSGRSITTGRGFRERLLAKLKR